MAKVFTSEDLIASVQRRISIPSDIESEGKQDQDILDVLDEVLLDELVPAVIKYREDYLTRALTFAITQAQTFYPVPTRAVGNALRDIRFENGPDKEPLDLISRDRLVYYTSTPTTVPRYFYWDGNSIVLVPPGTAGSLIMAFSFRPGQLVLAENYRKVAVGGVVSSTEITLDSAAPTSWVAGTTVLDVHSAESGAEVRVFDAATATVSGTQVIFSAAIDGSVDGTRAVEPGDYVVEAGHAAVPAIPRDAHPALAQAAACRLLESDGDSEMLRIGRETLGRQLQNFNMLFESRVKTKPPKIVNRRSLLFAQSRGN